MSSSSINFMGVLTVAGLCFIVNYVRRLNRREKRKQEKMEREYQPTLQDKRLNDGGNVYVANILGQPRVGSVWERRRYGSTFFWQGVYYWKRKEKKNHVRKSSNSSPIVLSTVSDDLIIFGGSSKDAPLSSVSDCETSIRCQNGRTSVHLEDG